jgi:hypothetical protein
MIDAAAYRANETNAKRAIADWRLSNINDPYVFQNQGFPVRADSFLDLAQILDTMQEGRFDYYMKEIGGFTEEDTAAFVKVCLDYIDFYCAFFQRERVVVPLSTLISHFVIYKKLIGYNPGFTRLLEIGPGCGYLSFFLRNHAPLADYTQIESTESFYLLQSHINAHVFGPGFAEHAVSRHALYDHAAYHPKLNWHNPFHYESQNVINVKAQSVCNHYPWWRIGEVARRKYDIVTSNANLNEFSREALFQYLSLIRDVLADDGVIIAQCLGGGPPSYDTIFANIKAAEFVPVALVQVSDVPGRVFVVSNAVFVGRKHPLYAKYADATPRFPTLDRSLDFVNKMYFLNEDQPDRKRVLTISEILKALLQQISLSGTTGARLTGSDELTATIDRIGAEAPLRNSNRLRPIAAADEREEPGTQAHGDRHNEADRRELEELRNESARLSANVEILHRDIERMLASKSWRITAPLRLAGSWTRRLRR